MSAQGQIRNLAANKRKSWVSMRGDYPLRSCTNYMDIKLILLALTAVFTVSCLFFGTRNGFYDSDNYDGNGSAH